jgi:hypothetical protein
MVFSVEMSRTVSEKLLYESWRTSGSTTSGQVFNNRIFEKALHQSLTFSDSEKKPVDTSRPEK